MSRWTFPRSKRRKETTYTPLTPSTHELPTLNELDRHDPTVLALTASSEHQPLPGIPKRSRG